MGGKIKNVIPHVWALKSIWVTVLAFIVPIKLLISYQPETEKLSKCAYGIVVMSILWLTEAIPIPVTALLPIFMFPMLGVVEAKVMSEAYITDTSMLFFGGLVVAVALVECGLHKRITLLVMRLVGAQPMWLMLGLMGTTWFLSMWISNTAATSMMIPIIQAVLETLKVVKEDSEADLETYMAGQDNPGYKTEEEHSVDVNVIKFNNPEDKIESGPTHPDELTLDKGHRLEIQVRPAKPSRQHSTGFIENIDRLAKAFSLSVAYGANIGGIATLTGTPPNLVLKQFADELYIDATGDPSAESDITFARWMGFALPMSLFTVVVSWFWLILIYLRCSCFQKMDRVLKRQIRSTIRKQYNELGPLSFMEIEVMVVFIVLVFLWLFRSPPSFDGWGSLFAKDGTRYVSDSTPSILLAVVLFILPAKKPEVFCWAKGKPSYTPILTWQKVSANLPWGVILLLGGGFALARASDESKLSTWVGEKLEVFADLDTWVMNLIICVIVAGLTEMTSNTATATLLMPILASLGVTTGIHPLYLMISAAVACSYAFMLPVATPPNAIVFSTGYLSVVDMVLAGFPMNIIAVLCLTLSINTWGKSMFDLGEFPDTFKQYVPTVSTTSAANLTTLLP